jgi:hypothetical protein
MGYHAFAQGVNVMWCLRNVVSLVLLFTSMAAADSLDGDWCNEDGSRLRFEGPQIILPGGLTARGDNQRHRFTYVAPPGDFEAGKEILFVLRSDGQMRRVRDPQAMPEHADIWQRCQSISFFPMRDKMLSGGING